MACYNCIAGDLVQVNEVGEVEEYRCNLCGYTIKYECSNCEKVLEPGEGTAVEGIDGLPAMLCRDCTSSNEEDEDLETDWDVTISD
ncbi:hypothetical protein MKZ21_30985 [Paenibacillus sp. FSL P2-0536]|uniref:hypothetical protein n=1 Tax=Paenibacillus sp. FSL P2-0536 TaxID=2921629 RepID=UPI0030F5629E